MLDRDQRIIAVIQSLREGEVVSYGDIAADAGYPKLCRLVGSVLAGSELDLPWWRVVNSSGRLVPGSEMDQTQLLRSEGVTVDGGRVRRAPMGRFSQPSRS